MNRYRLQLYFISVSNFRNNLKWYRIFVRIGKKIVFVYANIIHTADVLESFGSYQNDCRTNEPIYIDPPKHKREWDEKWRRIWEHFVWNKRWSVKNQRRAFSKFVLMNLPPKQTVLWKSVKMCCYSMYILYRVEQWNKESQKSAPR